jgi:hypothetical protein
MKITLFIIATFLALSVSSKAHGFDGSEFKFYCQQDDLERETKIQHTFISRIFTVKSRYARYCYEANLLAQQDKFYNYLAREYDHLNLNHFPGNCYCFPTKAAANVNYKRKLQKLRSTPDIKLYLIRTFPN